MRHPSYELNEYGVYETPRQAEVRILIMKGLTNKAIGDLLGIREKSVKYLTGQIYKNWDVPTRTKLMARVADLDRMNGVKPLPKSRVRT